MLRPGESRFELENFILNLDLQQGFTARPARDTRITADISVDGKAKTFDLSDFNARILDAALSGRATIDSSGKVPDISFDFSGKDIHLDHLMPAAPSREQDPGKEPSPEADPSSEPLDTSFLHAFKADGKIKLENIHSQGLTINEFSARIRSENGQMDIDPVKIILYQGVMDADLQMYEQGNALGLNVDQQLKGFQTGTFLKDLTDKDFFTGTLNLESSLQTSAQQNQDFLNNLTGTAQIAVSDGIIKGLDLEALIRQAFALASGEIDKIADSGQGSTPFTSLQADFAVQNGIARSSNLTLTSPVLGLKGKLAAHLPESSLNSSASLSLDGALQQELQSRYEFEDLSIPLKAEGPFDNIRVSVDKEALISSLAKQKGQDALEKILDKALPSSQENQDKGSDPAESMKGLLKNLMPGN